ncbi:MAG: hypothetical protein H6738_24040 [Alphaproteobacteria bacterium]|nr:hypothetical protein [Alphaproteobacteria bacterium]MCB9699880.1 hypothetical protein [Alphaproteobacteria bacterium]
MSSDGFQDRVTTLLQANNASGPYLMSLVCTSQGLVVASAGDAIAEEDVAAFTCLFDDIVKRAVRDLHFQRVDEVTLLDPGRGRTIIRPLAMGGSVPFFLVVRADPKTSWRRNTSRLANELQHELTPFADLEEGAA